MQIKQENDGHAVIDQLTGEEVLTCAKGVESDEAGTVYGIQ